MKRKSISALADGGKDVGNDKKHYATTAIPLRTMHVPFSRRVTNLRWTKAAFRSKKNKTKLNINLDKLKLSKSQ
ncbi:hypothetical protein CHS0354_024786 [Potamilus streckersoni]|uniref:Uncharacterized protein n=1 Tax=Potamilus streckersoni TaxID=2493646 RepID=A0AAE0W5K5_9BIVA|nr:hypothetical protein CHS0354_024786 [Potamilus streckersoni]